MSGYEVGWWRPEWQKEEERLVRARAVEDRQHRERQIQKLVKRGVPVIAAIAAMLFVLWISS